MSRHRTKTAIPAPPVLTKPTGEPKIVPAPALDRLAEQHELASVELTRLLAYQKWEAAGKPPGNGVQFWLAAEQERWATEEGRFAR